jgi:hypothetical protein
MGGKSAKDKTSTCTHEIQPAKPDSRQGSIQSAAGKGEGANRGVPPTIHKVHARCLRQVERHTASFQADKENSDMYVIHLRESADMAIVLRARLTEVLNGGISGLGAHCTFKATDLKMVPSADIRCAGTIDSRRNQRAAAGMRSDLKSSQTG